MIRTNTCLKSATRWMPGPTGFRKLSRERTAPATWFTLATALSNEHRLCHFAYPNLKVFDTLRKNQQVAFGGGPLVGSKIVRFIYVDEAGISSHEPFAVVAGMFVHGDDELIPLENEIDRIVRKYIPEENWSDFRFSMKELWSGTKYFKSRDEWPIERRIPIMKELASVPGKLKLPIVHGYAEKAQLRSSNTRYEKMSAHDQNIIFHTIAFTVCTRVAEGAMRKGCPDEVAQLVAENNKASHRMIHDAVELFRNPDQLKFFGIGDMDLPLERIRNSVLFAEKSACKPLQIADMCAFFIRGHYSGHNQACSFFEMLKPHMLAVRKKDLSDHELSQRRASGEQFL